MPGMDRYIILGWQGRLEPLHDQLVREGIMIAGTLPLIGGVLCELGEVSVSEVRSLDQVVWVEKDSRVYVIGERHKAINPASLETIPWGVRRVGAPDYWETSRGRGVSVGVLDSGIDLSHPDLEPNLAPGINILVPQAEPTDDNGHGTHVAGVIAAVSNGRGIIGVAPEATLVPIKVFDQTGESRLSSVVMGIEWAVNRQIRILNMSFGTVQASVAMRRAVSAAFGAGVVIIGAAGNDPEQTIVDYPARFRGVLGVGASTIENEVAEFSQGGVGLDLVAPGKDILSTWPGGLFETMSGTSMAAAHMSGIAALILAVRPELNPNELFDLILEAAVPLGDTATSRQGAGLFDLSILS